MVDLKLYLAAGKILKDFQKPSNFACQHLNFRPLMSQTPMMLKPPTLSRPLSTGSTGAMVTLLFKINTGQATA